MICYDKSNPRGFIYDRYNFGDNIYFSENMVKNKKDKRWKKINKIPLEDLVIECSKCGNKYGLNEIFEKLGYTSIFQFEYEFFCKNCEGNEFNIQFEFIPKDY